MWHIRATSGKKLVQPARKNYIIFTIVVAIIGGVTWVITRAATPVASFEAESSVKSGVNTTSDANASGGSAIQFVAGTTGGLESAQCGTWVIQEVSSLTQLNSLRPKIEDALALPGVVGFSVRFPWDAADISGTATTHPILDKAREIASGKSKKLAIRFMAGAHTPTRVFDAGAAWYQNGADKSPLPWDGPSGSHQVWLTEYNKYVGKLAAWSRANDVKLLHLSWYGQDWAELNLGAEVRGGASVPVNNSNPATSPTGYTYNLWLAGHKELIDIGYAYAGADLSVELPMSGYGPVAGTASPALADYIISKAGANSDRFFVQANGWNETQEWGAPDTTTENQFRTIWNKPVKRGLQMIQPDGYDWTLVYGRLTAVSATYAEVYLPSFWQVPGPTAQYNHNTTARITQLESEINAFYNAQCQ